MLVGLSVTKLAVRCQFVAVRSDIRSTVFVEPTTGLWSVTCILLLDTVMSVIVVGAG